MQGEPVWMWKFAPSGLINKGSSNKFSNPLKTSDSNIVIIKCTVENISIRETIFNTDTEVTSRNCITQQQSIRSLTDRNSFIAAIHYQIIFYNNICRSVTKIDSVTVASCKIPDNIILNRGCSQHKSQIQSIHIGKVITNKQRILNC